MYRYGAHRLFEDATLHGVSVDLVAFPREEAKEMLRESTLDSMIGHLTQRWE